MKFFQRVKRHPVLFAIVSPFAILIVILLGVVALPCETMRVVLVNESNVPAMVRVGVRYPAREVWRGRVEAGETRKMSLSVVPMGGIVDAFVHFPGVDDIEISRREEPLFVGYPLGIGIHRYRFSPGHIDSDTVFDLWADHFKSKPLRTAAFALEFVFIALRCADCEAAAWLRH